MTYPLADVCSAWATTDNLCEPCDAYDADFAALDDALFAASNTLWRLTGYQWPGMCEDIVRPCAQHTPMGRPHFTASAGWTHAAGWAEFAWSRYCACQSYDGCGCSHVPAITLGLTPLVEVSEVLIDGAVLDPSAYRLDEWRWLVRVDGDGWPCCQNMLADPATDENTFQVTFTYGQEPPRDGVTAAALLACEMYKACHGDGECELDDRVTRVDRQGISLDLEQVAMRIGRSGITGIRTVDLFIESVNPTNRRSSAFTVNPDDVPSVRRTGT